MIICITIFLCEHTQFTLHSKKWKILTFNSCETDSQKNIFLKGFKNIYFLINVHHCQHKTYNVKDWRGVPASFVFLSRQTLIGCGTDDIGQEDVML